MKTISKESETLILDSIQDVCDHVSEGTPPTDAVIKVAEARDLNKNFIRLVCTGYNTGATTYQREKGAGVLEKLADFPIANTEQVLEALYPSKVLSPAKTKAASVISEEYSMSPSAIKSAAAHIQEKVASMDLDYGIEKISYEIPREEQLIHALSERRDLQRQLRELRTKYAASQEDLMVTLGQLGDYFKQSNAEWSFEEVDSAVSTRLGEAGSLVMDYVFDRNGGKEKRAQDKLYRPVDWSAAPFHLAVECIKQAKEVNAQREAHRAGAQEIEGKIASLMAPFVQAQAEQPQETTESETSTIRTKVGGILSSVLGSSIAASMKPTPTSEKIEGMSQELSAPQHTDEMRAIKARTMLQDFLMNDEIIAGYDPDEVVTAFNEISQLSPRASIQPAVARPLLRKRLTQGAIEPFEAAEIANIEKTIQTTLGN